MTYLFDYSICLLILFWLPVICVQITVFLFALLESLIQPNTWPKWKEIYTHFKIWTKLTEDAEEIHISCLIYAMGQRQREYFRVLLSPLEKIEKVLQSVDRYFSPKESHILAREISHPWPMPMIICRENCQHNQAVHCIFVTRCTYTVSIRRWYHAKRKH